MTDLFAKALEAARKLSPEQQDEIARAILHLTGSEGAPEVMEPEHLAAVLEGLDQVKSGQLASDADVEAALRRFAP